MFAAALSRPPTVGEAEAHRRGYLKSLAAATTALALPGPRAIASGGSIARSPR